MSEDQKHVVRCAYLDLRALFDNRDDPLCVAEICEAAEVTLADMEHTFADELKDLIAEIKESEDA